MSRRQPTRMSLEQTLEQERRDILEALGEGSTSLQFRANRASYSPSTRHGSMQLDYSPAPGTSLPPRHGSIAGIGVGVTPPSQPYSAAENTNTDHVHGSSHRRVWTGPTLSSPLRLNSSAASTGSLPLSAHEQQLHEGADDPETTVAASSAPRKLFDGPDRFKKAVQVGRAAAASPQPETMSSSDQTKRAKMPSSASSSLPPTTPTASQPQTGREKAGRRPKSAVMSGFDLKVGLPSFARGRDSSVRRSTSRGSSLDSRVSSRLARSMSPRNRWLQSNPLSLATSTLKSSNKLITDKGKVIDMDSAYKHLSDAALSKLPGSTKPGSRRGSIDGGGSTTSAGDERLEKDMYDSENNPLSETSDEEEFDDESSSSDGESIRGRKVSIEVLPPSEERPSTEGPSTEGPSTEKGDESTAAEESTFYSLFYSCLELS